MITSRILVGAVMLLSLVTCRAENPSVQRSSFIEDVELSDLLANPKQYHRSRIRVKGIARIEFEGNSLYSDREAFMSKNSNKAIWLAVGWPVEDEVRALNARDVVVEATFDSMSKGHESAFAGSLVDVSKLVSAP